MSTREEKNKEVQEEILREERREKGLKVVKIILKVILIIMIISFISYFYITNVATTSLVVNEKRLESSTLPDCFNGFKIIHFSDLLYSDTTKDEVIRKLIDEINLRKPDLVIFTGDLTAKDYDLSNKKQEKLIKYLSDINATTGKYAVDGDNDQEQYNTIMNQADFVVLNNQTDLIYESDVNPILLVGLSSLNKNERHIDEAFKYFKDENNNKEIYTITMMHETDSIDYILENYKSDLMLGGNSLNGTIRLGFGLLSETGSKTYNDPYYKIDNTEVFISSGIGTLDIPFRINNRPSINFLRLSKN